MGCHTWFYTKLEVQPSYEEVREKYLNFLDNERGYFERHISGTLSEDESWLFDDKTLEDSEYTLSVLNRIYSRVLNRYCKIATLRHASYDCLNLEFCDKNNLYYKEVDRHDIFRIGGYPNDELLSMAETLEFLKINDYKIFRNSTLEQREEVIADMQKFWDEYPNGLVRFG